MQNKMEIADAFCKAVDIIVDRKLEKLAFNYTIVGQIKTDFKPTSANITTEYPIEYQNKTFFARPLDTQAIYSGGDMVYILVPNQAEDRTYYILGLVKVQNTASKIVELEHQIELLQQQLIELKGGA